MWVLGSILICGGPCDALVGDASVMLAEHNVKGACHIAVIQMVYCVLHDVWCTLCHLHTDCRLVEHDAWLQGSECVVACGARNIVTMHGEACISVAAAHAGQSSAAALTIQFVGQPGAIWQYHSLHTLSRQNEVQRHQPKKPAKDNLESFH